ncbi:iron-containing redox enzyme family protein [Actinoallomurus bryophytorum]|uniref:Heme oxygenase-like protein n=1 Tax=Actinoallomurus bryophytorum TaxID=1490222 RepID=A0A543CJB9_9ACTN|nr:iron-containing redox enzyme family protein [Actinoallomurus bryophytorum]TQL97203.1 heme oxygenase-like protein [Actinoallomurus bryophytorum]
MISNIDERTVAPALPGTRGPLSEAIITALRTGSLDPLSGVGPAQADPFGEDLQLGLYVCYELHYRGFDEVDSGWEWEPELLRVRRLLERRFLSAMRAATSGGDDADAALDRVVLETSDAGGVSGYLRDEGEWWELREFLAHRSLYHLKEADPHAWVIPRLHGRAKASLVAVEFDEFGGGRADRMHSRLFAELMDGVGLDPGYGRYLDVVPAVTLATVNMMSLFGLHRALRGALVGHFAAAEISTPPSAQRMVEALDRMGADPRCDEFFTEHIEADAVHEQVLRHDVVGDLIAHEPDLAADVVLGVQVTEMLEGRLGRHLLAQWSAGRSSLRSALPSARAPGPRDS